MRGGVLGGGHGWDKTFCDGEGYVRGSVTVPLAWRFLGLANTVTWGEIGGPV